MGLRSWLSTSILGATVFACTPAYAPDYSRRYHLFVDEQLPPKWIHKGADDWTRVTGYAFDIKVLAHDDAVLQSRSMWPEDTLIMVDATGLKTCYPGMVACFHGSGAFFFPKSISEDVQPPKYQIIKGIMTSVKDENGSWDRVPAHEIGHFLKLDHVANRRSIMRTRTDLQTSEPTLDDGKLVNPN